MGENYNDQDCKVNYNDPISLIVKLYKYICNLVKYVASHSNLKY